VTLNDWAINFTTAVKGASSAISMLILKNNFNKKISTF
jgi:hypothetical protein